MRDARSTETSVRPAISPMAAARRGLRAELSQARLLLRRQLVLEPNHQDNLRAFDLALRREDLVQLRGHLRLVHRLLLEKPDEVVHRVLKLPLQLHEPRLRLENLGADEALLSFIETDGVPMRHDEIGREQ